MKCLESAVFSRRFACFMSQSYSFSLVLPIRAETREIIFR